MENQHTNWYAVEVDVSTEAAEAIEFALNELDSLGNEINNLGRTDAKELTVIGYFNVLPNKEILTIKLSEALKIYGFSSDKITKVETKVIENQDWLAEWKKHWKPTETDKFIILPPWEDVKSNNKHIIKIEPNMAFGTGTHETTRLCVRAIEQNYRSEMSFFDVGTGTGILSIAAAKIQVESDEAKGKILGCDLDVDSVKIAKENTELNGINDVEIYLGSIMQESPRFDFVCANVTADIIIPLVPLLLEKSKQILVLSGILVEQEDLVLAEFKRLNIESPKVEIDGEWLSMTIVT